ncbi:MAG: CRISPR-associated protein Cas4 [Thermoproteota archaeon]|nr:MAG: CRISPR-associated protein Cas4 [Candidatus Korarchaeota archaeon]
MALIPLTVSEVAAHVYCPRAMILRRLGAAGPYSMGRAAHNARAAAAKGTLDREKLIEEALKAEVTRRQAEEVADAVLALIKEKGEVPGKLHIEAEVKSEKLKLKGRVDILAIKEGRAYPVEVKWDTKPRPWHIVQLTLYTIILEEQGYTTPYSILELLKAKRRVKVVGSTDLRQQALKAAEEASLTATQAKPPQPKGDCKTCWLKTPCKLLFT